MKVGDIVIRLKDEYCDMLKGDLGTVTEITEHGIHLKEWKSEKNSEGSGCHSKDNLRVVDNPNNLPEIKLQSVIEKEVQRLKDKS